MWLVHVQWLMLCTLCYVSPTLKDSWGEKVSLPFSLCCLHPHFRLVDDPRCISGTNGDPRGDPTVTLVNWKRLLHVCLRVRKDSA